ncbi:hypothetical protein AAHW31_07710 [Klebsiella variicola subsp. variicola]|uniref:hypothetical protein n=1 Tax=Klebsiella variicola TaxID=244366 RepID=UPI0035B3E6B0
MIVQNQNNPLAPVTGPSADQLLNAFEQHAAALRGEGQAQSTLTPTNPFKANVGQQDAQQEHIAKMEQYAAPIGVNIFDTQSDYTDEKHKRFADTLDKDPASILADYGQNEIDPILDKHHGPHSASHKVSLHSKGGE